MSSIFTNYREVGIGETFYIENVSFPSQVYIDFGDSSDVLTTSFSKIPYSYSSEGRYEISTYDFTGYGFTYEEALSASNSQGFFVLSGEVILATDALEAIETDEEDVVLKLGEYGGVFNLDDFKSESLVVDVVGELEYEDDELTNVYLDPILPHPRLKVSSNQIVTASVMNSLFDRLYENFEYVDSQTRFIDTFDNANEFTGQLSSDLTPTNSSWVSEYDGTLSAGADITDIKSTEKHIYIADGNTIYAIEFNRKNSPVVYLTSGKYNYQFTRINSFFVKEDNEFYILDNNRNLYRLRVLSSTDLKLVAYKLFGEDVLDFAYNPSNNSVYVLKFSKLEKYSENFELLDEMTLTGRPVKLCVDENENVFIYDQSATISTYNSSMEIVSTVNVGNEFNFTSLRDIVKTLQFNDIKRFVVDNRGFYFYLVVDSAVIKIGKNGKLVNAVKTGNDLTSCYQDFFGNLFVTTQNRIEKYYSGILVKNLRSTAIPFLYEKSDFHFNEKESVSSWVYNEKILRFLKMLENYMLSLQFRLTVNYLDSEINGFSFTDILNSKLFDVIDYDNKDYMIGINESVSSVVINRSFKYSIDVMNKLLSSIGIAKSFEFSNTDFILPTKF